MSLKGQPHFSHFTDTKFKLNSQKLTNKLNQERMISPFYLALTGILEVATKSAQDSPIKFEELISIPNDFWLMSFLGVITNLCKVDVVKFASIELIVPVIGLS